jgi:lysophospholipase L1-like esterase
MSGREKSIAALQKTKMIRIFAVFLLAGTVSAASVEWSKAWVAAFHNSKTEPVHVVVLSDSTAHVDQTNGVGYGPDQRSNLWPNQLQTALARFAPGRSTGTGLLTLEANAGRFDTDVWRLSQPYAYNPSIGPYQPSLGRGGVVPANGGTVQLTAGAEASLSSQYGDTLWIYWASCANSAAFTVQVDSSPSSSFGGERSPSCTAKRTRVFNGPLGNHTVTIKAGDGSAYLYAAEWTAGNAGIAVDNLAVGGATTTFFNSSDKLAFVHTIPNVGLAIIALGINDFAHDVPLESYESGLTSIIEDFKKNSPKASILIVSQYTVLSDTMRNPSELSQSQYREAARRTAANHKVGYLDLSDVWRSFSIANQSGILTSDRVHPSDAGGQQISLQIQHVIVDQLGLRHESH